jgi:hypothetical protein
MTQSFTLKIVVLIWFVSITSNLPWVYMTEYTAIYFRDNGRFEYKCGTISKGDWTFSYMILSTFVFYALIGIILIFLYYKISKNLKKSNKFLTKNATRNQKEKGSKYNSNPNNLLNETKGSHLAANNEEEENIMPKTKHSIAKSKNISSIKKSDIKGNKTEIDNKAIVNRKKLISMIMWVIICFYVCLTPIKAWNLGKKFNLNLKLENASYLMFLY